MTDDLAAFIAARLGEDEHIARMAAEDASASANWHVDARYEHSGHAGISGENGEVVVFDEGSPAQMEAEHIARHDPARVLREVAAGRALIHALISGDEMRTPDYWAGLELAAKFRAAIWSDHPDYRAEWKP